MDDLVIKEREYEHSIDEVWNAISEGKNISVWFIHADFKAEVGYEYTFTATEEHGGTVIQGRVLQAAPYTLKYTWKVAGTDIETTVTWILSEDNGVTKLRLEHSGMTQFGEAAEQSAAHFSTGWDACFSGLEKFFTNEVEGPAH